jgi:hypothetical protein
MYKWLEEELKTIRNRKFHLVRGAAPVYSSWKKKEIDWPVPPPSEFRHFLSQFGAAFLYRCGNFWCLRIFEKPYLIEARNGSRFLCFGGYDSHRGMFHLESLQSTGDSPVYMDEGGHFTEVATFAQWIRDHAAKAKGKYTQKEWQEIIDGPPPFSLEEEHIVSARKKFKWTIQGVTENGEIVIEVCNESDIVLPFLTFDVEIVGRNLVGGMYLPVSHVKPGETHACTKMTYCRLSKKRDIELHLAAEPWPEDRDYYWEFRNPPTSPGEV